MNTAERMQTAGMTALIYHDRVAYLNLFTAFRIGTNFRVTKFKNLLRLAMPTHHTSKAAEAKKCNNHFLQYLNVQNVSLNN